MGIGNWIDEETAASAAGTDILGNGDTHDPLCVTGVMFERWLWEQEARRLPEPV